MTFNQAMLPAETIKTRDAAEAVFFLYEMFEAGGAGVDDWAEELQEKWPDLAAMLFTISRDE